MSVLVSPDTSYDFPVQLLYIPCNRGAADIQRLCIFVVGVFRMFLDGGDEARSRVGRFYSIIYSIINSITRGFLIL